MNKIKTYEYNRTFHYKLETKPTNRKGLSVYRSVVLETFDNHSPKKICERGVSLR